mmetsp:Transcript_40738/g.89032  ORF Transcript_40738/g.89032 Transcript_40738/m.89032 type:complete len:115 (-) Transcript_40738:312-656(-)
MTDESFGVDTATRAAVAPSMPPFEGGPTMVDAPDGEAVATGMALQCPLPTVLAEEEEGTELVPTEFCVVGRFNEPPSFFPRWGELVATGGCTAPELLENCTRQDEEQVECMTCF